MPKNTCDGATSDAMAEGLLREDADREMRQLNSAPRLAVATGWGGRAGARSMRKRAPSAPRPAIASNRLFISFFPAFAIVHICAPLDPILRHRHRQRHEEGSAKCPHLAGWPD
jgi:hypothetical protein